MVKEFNGQPGRKLIDLELQRITKAFEEQVVISNLSLLVHKGELCCLLGPSGCGKSTTLKIIAGLVKPDSGSILLAEKDITNLPAQKRNVSILFQNYALFPHLDVFNNIAYGLRRRKVSADVIKLKVSEILHLVELDGYEQRRIHELSGGQQQRVALARSLVIEPDLLLLDEPLSNLDARLRENMRREIRKIQQTLDITTIFVTHDQEEAMSISDRIGVMNEGMIEQIGSPREIYDHPKNAFVAEFIGKANFIPGVVFRGSLILLGRSYPLDLDANLEGKSLIGSIRPELIRMGERTGEGISAEVVDLVFNGSIANYYVRVAADDEPSNTLLVEVASPKARFNIGDKIRLNFDPEDIRYFS